MGESERSAFVLLVNMGLLHDISTSGLFTQEQLSYPDVVRDAADGDNRVSCEKKVLRHFLSQSHGAERVQVTEDHLPLCPTRSHAGRQSEQQGVKRTAIM